MLTIVYVHTADFVMIVSIGPAFACGLGTGNSRGHTYMEEDEQTTQWENKQAGTTYINFTNKRILDTVKMVTNKVSRSIN